MFELYHAYEMLIATCLCADIELPVACAILICLFALQHYGTHKVGFLFAPIICIWLLCISAIGLYNIIHWDHHVYRALSPYYMYQFLRKTQTGGWMSLGGILLCVTGIDKLGCCYLLFDCGNTWILVTEVWLLFFSIVGKTFRLWSYVCRSWTFFTVINPGIDEFVTIYNSKYCYVLYLQNFTDSQCSPFFLLIKSYIVYFRFLFFLQ